MMDSSPDAGAADRDEEIREWLSRALGCAFRTEPASSDASFRRYLRVSVSNGTFILMDAPPEHEDCRPFVHVQSLLKRAGVNVPDIIEADAHRGLLLLSDLGTRSYLDVIDEANCGALYRDALDALVRMQAGVPAAEVEPFDEGKLRAELNLFPRWFLEKHLGLGISQGLGRAMEACFDALVERCLEQPQVFVHRDYHSRNLMVTEKHRPGVLDFQDAVSGPVTYDLVSLFRDVYIEWPQSRVEDWVAAYYRRASGALQALSSVSADEFLEWFDLTGVQRHIKVAGIFCRLWHRDGKPRYLRDVPLTLRYLMSVGARYPESRGFVEALQALGVEKRFAAATVPE